MKRLIWLFLLLALLFSACQTQVEPTATVEPSTTSTATVTSTTTMEPTVTSTVTRTPRPTKPTKTPTITPISLSSEGAALREGDELPELEPIKLDNLDQLQEIAQWGYGQIYDVRLTPDEKQVVAATASGVFWFDGVTLETSQYVEYQESCNPLQMALSYSTEFVACLSQNQTSLSLIKTADGETIQKHEIEKSYNIWFTPDDQKLQANTKEIVIALDMETQKWFDTDIPRTKLIDYTTDGQTFIASTWFQDDIYCEVDGECKNIWTVIDPYSIYIGAWGAGTLEISDDGKYIAHGNSEQRSVDVWDVENEELVFTRCLDEDGCLTPADFDSSTGIKVSRPREYSGPSEGIKTVRISPNNKYLLVESWNASEPNRIHVFNIEDDILIRETQNSSIEHLVTYSSSRSYLNWGNSIEQYRYFNDEIFASTDNLFSISVHSISPDGEFAAVINDNKVILQSIIDGSIHIQQDFPFSPSDLDFFHSSERMVITFLNTSQDIQIWNYKNNLLTSIDGQYDEYLRWYYSSSRPSISIDDRYLYFIDYEGLGSFYDLVEPRPEWKFGIDYFYGHLGVFTNTENVFLNIPDIWTEDSPRVSYAIIDENGNFIQESQLILPKCKNILTFGVLPSGNGSYCATEDNLVFYDHDWTEISVITDWACELDPYQYFKFSNDLAITKDDTLVFGFVDNNFHIYDVAKQRKIEEYQFSADIAFVLLSPDQKTLIVNGTDGIVRIVGVPATP